MALEISVKQKEAKLIRLTITAAGAALDVSTATCLLALKQRKSDMAFAIEKLDSSFDKTEAVAGILRVNLSRDDLDLVPGDYIAELKLSFASDNINKSADIKFKVLAAVTS
jgi:hypothetical protein